MPDRQEPLPTPMAIKPKTERARITATEMTAIILSVLWLALAAAFFLLGDPAAAFGGQGGAVWFLVVMLAVFMPVGMIWVAATAARASKVMRDESQRLQVAIDAIRHAYITQSQNRNAQAEPSVARKLEEIAAAQRKTETALAMFSSSRTATPAPAPARPPAPEPQADDGTDQAALPLGTRAEEMRPPLDNADFIRALNFPDTAEDKDGFAALRRALKDRDATRLIRAAQDVLTLMSQDGIYMDDLRPDLARPEIWRRFAAGERGRAVAMLGGIRDRTSLALTAARMKKDPIFRDTAHHFLRLFDRGIFAFAETATDAELSEMSNTRTARAFMLLGRVTGTFD
ncbi:hypothetical protein [Roseovarius amoyensis]|uniref:hypothetical protein n=1 Tax=Roseovarius amoyensis TaxID=2211448 RepID=UPI000DBE1B32|nr:hypothetical protein [Roseovarius amoyensis]